ncbi:MAG: hypothetical protein IKD59_01150 [Lachnospiraceae bacterium]|nr:hypothetical protein [Lachnospiraceae bacterium]
MRLIDADALKFDIMCVYGSNPQYINWLNHAPTVDAVPVIRCKDCKWYYRGGATCMFWDGANSMCGDDYCSRAEVKEE